MLNLFYTTMGSGVFLLTPTFIIEPKTIINRELLKNREKIKRMNRYIDKLTKICYNKTENNIM